MRNLQAPSARRRGAIVPFMALMLVAIMGFVALAVDLGYIAMVHAQLQNAADSSALAGASQLLDKSVLTGSANQDTAKSNARTQAQSFSQSTVGLTLGIKSFSIIGYLHDDRTIEPVNIHFCLAGVGMTGDICERFLRYSV